MNIDESENILRKELGERLSVNAPLAPYTIVGVGGVANFLTIAKDIESLTLAITAAQKAGVPFTVLGKGSSVVVSDKGMPGLVIINQSSNIVFCPDGSEVIVDSGVCLANLINLAASRDLGGLEFLCGLPGTVGGAIYSNVGTGGLFMDDFVKNATIITIRRGEPEIVGVNNSWLQAAPYSSRLKTERAAGRQCVVLTARLQLVKRRKDEILRLIRGQLKKSSNDRRKAISHYFSEQTYLPAASRIERNYRKFRSGGARLMPVNRMVNVKNARGSDIRTVADMVRNEVVDAGGQSLIERIEYIGKW